MDKSLQITAVNKKPMTYKIPKAFFEFLLASPGIYKVMWVDWLALYEVDQMRDKKFVADLKYKSVPEETVLQCYHQGAKILAESGFFGKRKPVTARATPEQINTIISYLNQKAGTTYRASTPATAELINARLSEGFTVDDFKTVVDKKCAAWMGTDLEPYLRPLTLFSKKKFETYLNEKQPISKAKPSGGQQAYNAVHQALSKLAGEGQQNP